MGNVPGELMTTECVVSQEKVGVELAQEAGDDDGRC